MDVRLPSGQVLRNIPEGTSKKEIMDKALKNNLAVVEDFGDDYDFSASEMLSNIPASAKKLAVDMTAPIHSPGQTWEGVRSVIEGTLSKAFGWDSPDEETLGQLATAVKNRYGTWERAQRSLEQDPLGVVSDASAILTGGGTAAAKLPGMAGKIGSAVQRGGMAIDPVNAALNTGITGVKMAMPKGYGNEKIQSGMKYGTTLSPEERSGLAQTQIDYNIMPTQKGMDKARELTGQKAQQVEDIITELDASGVKTDVGALDATVYGLGEKYGRRTNTDAVDDVAKIDKFYTKARDNITEQGGVELKPSELQDFKTDQYGKINFARQNQAVDESVLADTRKSLARTAKEKLEQFDPRIQPLNQELGNLLSLYDTRKKTSPLARSSGRIANRDSMGIGVPIKAGAMEAVVPGAGVVGAAQGLLDAPLNAVKLGIKLGQLESKGLIDAMTSRSGLLSYAIREAGLLSGRTEDELF